MRSLRSYSLLKKVRQKIKDCSMTETGDSVLVGFSGGADSTALLLLMKELEPELGIAVSAFHVHHGLRENADGDERFCRSLCEKLGVPLSVFHVNAAEYARENRCSVEEAGRILRKQAAGECRKAQPEKHWKTALAHHAEDRAETFLLNLARGSALTGMQSILPVSGDIIRPLIDVSRSEIEEFLTEEGISWRTDESNASLSYTRNRIRHRVLPLLEEAVNSGAARHINAAAAEAEEAERYLAMMTDGAFERTCTSPEEGTVEVNTVRLLAEDPFLQGRVLYRALTGAAGRRKDISRVHVESLKDLMRNSGYHSLDLPYGVKACLSEGILMLQRTLQKTAGQEESGPDRQKRAEEGRYPLKSEDYAVRVFARPEGVPVPRGKFTKWFDYDKMNASFQLRGRESGDEITLGSGSKKLLKRFFIDEKIPAPVRGRIVLPACGKEILWIPGHRISAAFPVDDTTETILELTFVRPADGELRQK